MSFGYLLVDYIVDRFMGSKSARRPAPIGQTYNVQPDIDAARQLTSQHEHLWGDFSCATSEERYRFAITTTETLLADFGIPADCALKEPLSDVVHNLLYEEPAILPPNIPDIADLTPAQLTRLNNDLLHRVTVLGDPDIQKLAFDTITRLVDELLASLPRNICQALTANERPTVFAADISAVMHQPHAYIDQLVGTFIGGEELNEHQLYRLMGRQLYVNVLEASGAVVNPDRPLAEQDTRKPKWPSDCDKEPIIEVTDRYLRNTPLTDLLRVPIPLHVPPELRFQHAHILGGSGHGKTQTLQTLILEDIREVAAGNASVVVMDSQGDLIEKISHLAEFGPGGALEGKLTVIEPKDIEYPIQLNFFDVNMDRVSTYGPLMREQTINGIIELYNFVFGSLLGAELSSKQGTLFRYIARLMMHIPDANIQTLRQLMEPDGYERFKEPIASLGGTARRFFETEFNGKEFEQTKKQVLRRLWGILENQTFERMFSHPRNKLDIFQEMNEGRVILISTSKDLLKQEGTEIFGRFFIAMITQAILERAAITEQERMPTYFYCDECHDYCDENIALILEQARKYKLGMCLSHQYLGQLDAKSQQAIAANTSLKIVGGVSAKDARQLAPDLRTTPQFIEERGQGEFALHLRGLISTAIPFQTKFGVLESMDRMTAEEFNVIRDEMRQKYAVHYSQVQQSISDQLGYPEDVKNEDADGDGSESSKGPEPDEIAPSTYVPPRVTPTDPQNFSD
jgi:Helicase HerA, central domain